MLWDYYLLFLGSYSKYVVSNIFAAIVLVTAVIQLVMEIIRWCFSGREYFRSLQNYIEIILFPFSIVYVFVFTDACGCPKDWQWQIGLFVVFAAWMNLIIIASEFPKTGTYVIIFKEIFLTFLELLLSFGIILILAYTVILFMMFYSPTAMVRCNYYYTYVGLCSKLLEYFVHIGYMLVPSYVPLNLLECKM